MNKQVKEAKEMLEELEDKPKHAGVVGGLVGAFITIVIGTMVLDETIKTLKKTNSL